MGQLPGSGHWHVAMQAAGSRGSRRATTQHVQLARARQVPGSGADQETSSPPASCILRAYPGHEGTPWGALGRGLQALHARHAAAEHPGPADARTPRRPKEQDGCQGTWDGKALAVGVARPS